MYKGTYKKRIEQACKDAGTYQPFFNQAIDTLAGILENRDRAQKKFKEMNYDPVVTHTLKSGAANYAKNPALAIINDMNTQALRYWQELGLTAKSFQAMQKEGLKKKEKSFEDILANIGI